MNGVALGRGGEQRAERDVERPFPAPISGSAPASTSQARLHVLDGAVTVTTGLGASLLVLGRAPSVLLMVLLFMAHALILRAAVVPSRARRTLQLGIVALSPTLLQALVANPQPGDRVGSATAFVTLAILCAATTVLVSTLVSTKIYGLERTVARARRMGPYTLEEKIGEGGMGEVYKARHALLRRPTAIKIIRNSSNAETSARFEREVQLTSQLTHPNTVHVYDFGRAADGTFYYAMEYIEGLTLWQLVQLDGAQSPGRVVSLLVQICASLAEAHALGLIHRDVKPDNVLISVRGLVPDAVKVVDFGLARTVGTDSREEESGTVMGTARYMAPEVVSEPWGADARSDIYAVGALAYFLLTGSELFHGTTATILSQQIHAVPQRPSSRLGAELPADVERIVMRCLAKDPAMRPQSALALAAELRSTASAHDWTGVDGLDWWRRNGANFARALRASTPRSGSRSITSRVVDAS
ncbi:MAG: Serine/threonine protein kinase [Myxococcaceae bacterium]|nr:Serine/threonine protein kinase [Myxococcaceae bacterium]